MSENNETSPKSPNDWTPRPDPTKLTTEQLTREIAAAKELIFSQLATMDTTLRAVDQTFARRQLEVDRQVDDLKQYFESRLAGMDKATVLLQTILNEVPTRVDEKISAAKALHEEKFISIQTQFRERDVRTEQSSKDSKVAVDAALQAAKEAVGEQNKSSSMAISKSETATMKQIDQMGLLITTQAKGVDDKFTDVKDRIGRLESTAAEMGGMRVRLAETKKEGEWSIGMFIAIGTSMIAAALVVMNIIINAYSRYAGK